MCETSGFFLLNCILKLKLSIMLQEYMLIGGLEFLLQSIVHLDHESLIILQFNMLNILTFEYLEIDENVETKLEVKILKL